jgi:Flp pilus assembly protein TadG
MSAQSSRRRAARERGQSLVIITVFMFSLLGMAALAIDAGSWYQTKRSLQADADAAALAGASQLPISWSAAQTAAQAEYANNGNNSDSVTYQNTSNLTTNDTVTVTTSRTNPSYFAKLFGFSNATITATSKATVESYTKIVSNGQVMPWAVMQSSWTLGQQYSLYTDNTSPNNGAVSINGKDVNGNCQGTSGANDYSNEINGSLQVCDVSVGDVLPVKSGQNSGPTKQGITQRITTWDPISAIVQFTQNGQANILKPNSPQLVILPVVVNAADGSTTWPGGSGNLRVVGFAFFVLTSPGYAQNGKQVLGTFVGLQLNNTSWTTGAFNPGANTAYTVELTG